jgi:hypothetical protein
MSYMDEIQQHGPCKQNWIVVPQDELSNGMDENRCVWMQLPMWVKLNS